MYIKINMYLDVSWLIYNNIYQQSLNYKIVSKIVNKFYVYIYVYSYKYLIQEKRDVSDY